MSFISFHFLSVFFHSSVFFLHGQVTFLPAIELLASQAPFLLSYHSKSFGHIFDGQQSSAFICTKSQLPLKMAKVKGFAHESSAVSKILSMAFHSILGSDLTKFGEPLIISSSSMIVLLCSLIYVTGVILGS